MKKMKKVALITGASGALGQSFYYEIVRRYGENVDVILLQRRQVEFPLRSQDCAIYADVVTEAGKKSFEPMELGVGNYSEAFLVHAIGAFETEGDICKNPRTFLAKYLTESNVVSFWNVVYPFLAALQTQQRLPITVSVVCFGSVSDAYKVGYWRTFSEAKDLLREILRKLVGDRPTIRALMVNLSSVDTQSEERLRPNADKSFWLTCGEVAKESLKKLDALIDGYLEVDMYRPMPGFSPELYYKNLDAVRDKWEREMRQTACVETQKQIRREVPVVIKEIALKEK